MGNSRPQRCSPLCQLASSTCKTTTVHGAEGETACHEPQLARPVAHAGVLFPFNKQIMTLLAGICCRYTWTKPRTS